MTKCFLILLSCVIVSCSNNNDYIFNETFDQNNIGWIEENTDYHEIEIKNGKYHIHCKDTSSNQTSVSPMKVAFLLNLPKTYEINTTVKFVDGQKTNELGLILVSASMHYRFGLFSSGKTEVVKYDYNNDKETTICSTTKEDLRFKRGDNITIKIIISDRSFRYSINDNLVCKGTFQTKQWSDLRLFTSSTTIIEFDNLIFKKPN